MVSTHCEEDATGEGSEQRKFAGAAAVQAVFDRGSVTDRRSADLFKYLSSETNSTSPASSELPTHNPATRCCSTPHPGASYLAGTDLSCTVYIQNVFPYAPRLLQSTRTWNKHNQDQQLRLDKQCGNIGHYAEVCSSSERLCYNCERNYPNYSTWAALMISRQAAWPRVQPVPGTSHY